MYYMNEWALPTASMSISVVMVCACRFAPDTQNEPSRSGARTQVKQILIGHLWCGVKRENMRYMIAIMISIIITLSSCTATQARAFIRRDANVKDYLFFPQRVIPKGHSVSIFEISQNNTIAKKILQELNFTDLNTLVEKTKTQALIIVQDDSILLEKYGKHYNHNSIVTSFSVAKSVNSAIIGTLIDQGKIQSENDLVIQYIPELLSRDKRFEKVTIKHLLTMSSGILYAEKPNKRKDDTETYYNPDLRNLAIKNTVIQEDPGQHFFYNNYNPLLLGLIIERVSKESVSSYMSNALWSKLGCECNASWSLDSNENSFEKMESGVNAIAMDFVRFGCLYRDNGAINGQQIISKKWIEQSLADNNKAIEYYSDTWGKEIFSGIHGGYYGYGWYVMKRSNNLYDFFAIGNKGQIIYISPLANMVMVRFGEENIINIWKWITAFYNIGSEFQTTSDK
jgi:CubicO group peptidase (beta-lactamase class C family)